MTVMHHDSPLLHVVGTIVFYAKAIFGMFYSWKGKRTSPSLSPSRVRKRLKLGGTSRFLIKLRLSSKRSNYHSRNCASGRHGRTRRLPWRVILHASKTALPPPTVWEKSLRHLHYLGQHVFSPMMKILFTISFVFIVDISIFLCKVVVGATPFSKGNEFCLPKQYDAPSLAATVWSDDDDDGSISSSSFSSRSFDDEDSYTGDGYVVIAAAAGSVGNVVASTSGLTTRSKTKSITDRDGGDDFDDDDDDDGGDDDDHSGGSGGGPGGGGKKGDEDEDDQEEEDDEGDEEEEEDEEEVVYSPAAIGKKRKRTTLASKKKPNDPSASKEVSDDLLTALSGNLTALSSMESAATLDPPPMYNTDDVLDIAGTDSQNLLADFVTNYVTISDKPNVKKDLKLFSQLPEETQQKAEKFIASIFPTLGEKRTPESRYCTKAIILTAWSKLKELKEDGNDRDLETTIQSICSSLTDIAPKRALFQLMMRWAQRERKHFQRDSLYALTAVTNQVQLPMDQFLLNTKHWKLKWINQKKKNNPNCEKTKDDRIYVQIYYEKNPGPDYSHTVEKMQASIVALNQDILKNADIYFIGDGRVSCHTESSFNLNTTDASTHVTNMNPSAGMHKLNCFNKRLWLIIEHFHAGMIILRLIFSKHLVKANFPLKGTGQGFWTKDACALKLLIEITGKCQERSDFVTILVRLCLAFPTTDHADGNKEKVKDLWNDRMNMNTRLIECTNLDMVPALVSAFDGLHDMDHKKSALINKKQRTPLKDVYAIVRCAIFKRYLDFSSQSVMKREVHKRSKAFNVRKVRENNCGRASSSKKRRLIRQSENISADLDDDSTRADPLPLYDDKFIPIFGSSLLGSSREPSDPTYVFYNFISPFRFL